MSKISGLPQAKFSDRKSRYIQGNCDKWQLFASEAIMLIASFTALNRVRQRQDKSKYCHADDPIMW